MRTFEFKDSKSNKFWNIELSGSSFTVTFGRIGTNGQAQAKLLRTPRVRGRDTINSSRRN